MSVPTLANELSFPSGATIFRQGDAGHEMFVITKGKVQLSLGSGSHEKVVSVLSEGDFFGELSLLSDAPRTANAKATEDTVLFAIDRDVFRMMVQDDLDIVFRMLNALGQRLMRTNTPIELMVRTLSRARVLGHCAKKALAAGTPCRLAVAAVATELSTDREHVEDALRAAAARGAGTLSGDSWEIASQEQIRVLLETLCSEVGESAS